MTKDETRELDTLEASFSHDTFRMERLQARVHTYLPRLKELRREKQAADDRKEAAMLRRAKHFCGEEVFRAAD